MEAVCSDNHVMSSVFHFSLLTLVTLDQMFLLSEKSFLQILSVLNEGFWDFQKALSVGQMMLWAS